MSAKPRAIVVYCTCPDRESADKIASSLIADKIAACVSLTEGVVSTYQWQGKVEQDTEVQCMIKTRATHFECVRDVIRSIHPYETPEIIATDIVAGDEDYLRWIEETVLERD